MIVGEAFEVPAEQKKFLRLSVEELQKNYGLRTYHLREDGNGLVTAEGEEFVCDYPDRYTDFVAASDYLYGYEPSSRWLCRLDGAAKNGPFDGEPFFLFNYYNASGFLQQYCITSKDVTYMTLNTTTFVGQDKGGTCAALFRERMFTARGMRLHYSKAFEISDWYASRYRGGYIQLDTDGAGDILALIPYKDKLYLMRRNGISVLRVLGDELNFKITYLPVKCGALLDYGAALCGDSIGYFTDSGFYLFNGAVSVSAENSRFDEIDLSRGVKARSYKGKYYALVTKKTGDRAIYCYDPVWKQAHFIENGAEQFDCGNALCFVRAHKVYRISEKGICQNFMPYLTAEHVGFTAGEERMLRRLCVEGEGTFSVSIRSNRGTRTVTGSAQEILKLRSPLRGYDFQITISAAGDAEEIRFKALQLQFTEEKNDD